MREYLYWFMAAAGLFAAAALAQDAVRGQRLFNDTAQATGRKVAACAACHADVSALRQMIANRGGRVDDTHVLAIWLEAVLNGAHPGARNAMAQYKGALTTQDIADLAAYIAGAKRARAAPGASEVASR
jgi:cytochrome c553